MRQVSIKQTVEDNCAVIDLLLPTIKSVSNQNSIDLIYKATSEMRQAAQQIDTDAGYLIIDIKTQRRTISSMLTQDMIDKAISINRSIDIIRMSDGKILDVFDCKQGYKWFKLQTF